MSVMHGFCVTRIDPISDSMWCSHIPLQALRTNLRATLDASDRKAEARAGGVSSAPVRVHLIGHARNNMYVNISHAWL